MIQTLVLSASPPLFLPSCFFSSSSPPYFPQFKLFKRHVSPIVARYDSFVTAWELDKFKDKWQENVVEKKKPKKRRKKRRERRSKTAYQNVNGALSYFMRKIVDRVEIVRRAFEVAARLKFSTAITWKLLESRARLRDSKLKLALGLAHRESPEGRFPWRLRAITNPIKSLARASRRYPPIVKRIIL